MPLLMVLALVLQLELLLVLALTATRIATPQTRAPRLERRQCQMLHREARHAQPATTMIMHGDDADYGTANLCGAR